MSSSFLDTAIGIVFVFLLLSLIASTINELVLSFLSMRGKMLLQGIATLLNDENVEGLVQEIYNHGEIYGLYKGEFTATAAGLKKWWTRDKSLGNLPSYVPNSNFANAFLGVMVNKASQESKTALDGAKQAAAAAVMTAKTASDQATTVLSDPNSTQAQKDAARAAASAAQAAATAANLAADVRLFTMLREVAQGLGNAKVGQPLIEMLATAENDINKLKSGVEDWYKSAMGRVSGWYKYHTQWMLFWIGLALAVALNASTIEIAKQISRNDTLRQTLVNAAAKAPNPSEARSTQAQPTLLIGDVRTPWQANHVYAVNQMICTNGADGCTSGGNNVQLVTAVKDDKKSGDKVPQWSANPGDTTADNNVTWKNVGHAAIQNQLTEVEKQISEVQGLGLPLGWGNVKLPDGRSAVYYLYYPVGWLLTAIAVSLGAPFWFDLLNKFMVVRSTVKPQEKSKEEGSKDKQP